MLDTAEKKWKGKFGDWKKGTSMSGTDENIWKGLFRDLKNRTPITQMKITETEHLLI